jgi:hypothetical protein
VGDHAIPFGFHQEARLGRLKSGLLSFVRFEKKIGQNPTNYSKLAEAQNEYGYHQ